MEVALQGAGVVLIAFSAYAMMVYGSAARRILRRGGIRSSGWDIIRFCVVAGHDARPWRGRVLRDVRRMILVGAVAWFAGFALLILPALIKARV